MVGSKNRIVPAGGGGGGNNRLMRSFRGLNKKLKGVSSNMLTNGASVLKGASQLKGLVAGKPRVDVRDLRQHKDYKPLAWASIALVLFMVWGVVMYSLAGAGWDPEWKVIDALYFSVTTLTTVGYGDYLPPLSNDGWLGVTGLFVFVAVGLVGAALGVVASVLTAEQDNLEAMLEEGTAKSHMCSKTTRKIISNSVSILVLLAVGTLAFALLEDADAVDAFYWSSATLTTVGYGDFSPGTTGGKWFAVFYMLIGIAVVANALSDIASIPIAARRAKLEGLVLSQYGSDLSVEELADLTKNNKYGHRQEKSYCTRAAFTLAMLVKLGKVADADIVDCFDKFKTLDRNDDGVLSKVDVHLQKEAMRQEARLQEEEEEAAADAAAAEEAAAAQAAAAASGAGAGAGAGVSGDVEAPAGSASASASADASVGATNGAPPPGPPLVPTTLPDGRKASANNAQGRLPPLGSQEQR